ncbi:MAG: nucleotidyltransferase domain-containing protein [Oligoflexia bacterium]|nr:nucleotidyltransferase domain-containing protein [Oligoflexia bacterium]
MDKKTNKIINSYAEAVIKEVPNSSVILFGSYASGKNRKDSDIDIAVVLDHIPEGSFISLSALLWKLTTKVDTRIEPVLLEKNSLFLQDLLKEKNFKIK